MEELSSIFDRMNFQIGQCRLHINIADTKAFYVGQSRITDSCSSDYCKYYENEVIKQPNGLFEILRTMGVDLRKQSSISPDAISFSGINNGRVSYMGYYLVFGRIGKTSKKTAIITDGNIVDEVSFNDVEFGERTFVTIRQVEPGKLFFEFFMDIEITSN